MSNYRVYINNTETAIVQHNRLPCPDCKHLYHDQHNERIYFFCHKTRTLLSQYAARPFDEAYSLWEAYLYASQDYDPWPELTKRLSPVYNTLQLILR